MKGLAIVVLLLQALNSSGGSGSLLSTGKDTIVCAGKCVTLTAGMAGICKWSTGETTSSIRVCPTADQVIVLEINTGIVKLYDTVHIKVDKYCVFPGDADNNGKVDKDDVLKIGIGYGKTGSSRVSTGVTWDGSHADNWDRSFASGLNYKYADCNGDGKIDKNDLEAMHTNWTKKHSKTEEVTVDGNPDLYYVADHDTVVAGDTLVLHIFFGTVTNPVYNVYGLSFTHMFTPGTVVTGSMGLFVDITNCWFYNNNGTVMPFLQPDYDAETGDVVITRTNGMAASGFGQVGDLSVVVQDNVGGKRSVDEYISMKPIQAKAIGADEKEIPLTIKPASVYYSSTTTGISPTSNNSSLLIDVYPNPLKGNALTIQFYDVKAEKVEITDLLGNVVQTTVRPMTGKTEINLPDLKNGLYLIKAYSAQGMVTKKVNIVN